MSESGMVRERDRPPLYTVMVELVGWTMDRTAGFPKSQRFTFGQRLDNQTLDGLERVIDAIGARQARRRLDALQALDVGLERLRTLWRLVEQRGWISRQQLMHVSGRLDEAGRMVGGWIKKTGGDAPEAQ